MVLLTLSCIYVKQAIKSDKNDVDSSLTREDLVEDYKQVCMDINNDPFMYNI